MNIGFLDPVGWDYDVTTPLHRPLGGSQSTACYLATELARQGHNILFLNDISNAGEYDGVQCANRNRSDFPQVMHRLDVLVVLNLACALLLRRAMAAAKVTKPLVLWTQHAHDQQAVAALSDPQEREAWSAFAFVSEWQARNYVQQFGISRDKWTVLHNCISPAFAEEPVRAPWFETGEAPVLAYASTPFRGLDVLLDSFPAIRAAIPGVRLRVFSSMNVYQIARESDPFHELYAKCTSMDGVEYAGSLGQSQLAKDISGAAALAYPSTFAETFCISAAEAMSAGAVLLTTRLGALPELHGEFGQMIDFSPDKQKLGLSFAELTIKMLQDALRDPESAALRRKAQIDSYRTRFNCVPQARRWLSWLQTVAVAGISSAKSDSVFGVAIEQRNAGRFPEAEALCRQILQLAPDRSDAWCLLGEIHHAQARIAEATKCYERAILLQPDYAQANSNLGAALHATGRLEEAAAHCEKAIECQPDFANAHYNLALIRHDQGRLDEAEARYIAALEVAPAYFEAAYNLGALLQASGRYEEGMSRYRQALAINPRCAEAHRSLAGVFGDMGDVKQSEQHALEASRLQPDKVFWRPEWNMNIPVIPRDRNDVSSWRPQIERILQNHVPFDLRDKLAELAAGHLIPPFYASYQGFDERIARTRFAQLFRIDAPPKRPPHAGRRPRIGFVVTAGHEGAFLNLTRGIINQISTELRPSIVCAAGAVNSIRAALSVETGFVPMPRSLPAAVEAVRREEFDLLYYWEIGTDPANYFLPFFDLAPVQCTAWGYPVTTGIPSVNHFISSTLLEAPDAADHYSESLALLDSLPVYYYKPKLTEPLRNRTQIGLRNGTTAYVCPQSLFKFQPDFDDALGNILRADGNGELILIEGAHRHWTELLRNRFQKTIPDVLERIRFLPRLSPQNFLHLLANADVLLDAFHWSGNNTTHDALAFGTPIVTLPSPYLRGRITLGCYALMGMTDCVATDAKNFVDIAVRLGTDPRSRERARREILARNHVLFENTSAVSNLEGFFLHALSHQ